MKALRLFVALWLAVPASAGQKTVSISLPIGPTVAGFAPTVGGVQSAAMPSATLLPSAAVGAPQNLFAAAPAALTARAPAPQAAFTQVGRVNGLAAVAAGPKASAEVGFFAASASFDGLFASAGGIKDAAQTVAAPAKNSAPLGLIPHAASMLRRQHVDQPSVDRLLNKAMRGLLEKAGITTYKEARTHFVALRQAMRSQNYGLGFKWQMGGFKPQMENHMPAYVMEVLPYSPAEQAGMRAGEVIHAINHKPTEQMNGDEVAALFSSDIPITLTLGRLADDRRTWQRRPVTLQPRAFRHAGFDGYIPAITAAFKAAVEAAGSAAKPSDLLDAALHGMAASLDKYTEYFNVEEKKEFDTHYEQPSYGGFGVRFKMKGVGLRVEAVMPGSPADRAGLRIGDEVVMVDGSEVSGLNVEEGAKKLRRPVGGKVSLVYDRPGEGHQLVELTAEELALPLAAGSMLPGGVGYVHMTIFSEPAWDTAFAALGRMRHQGVKEVILDLRFNPGGRLDVALDMARSFLGKGKTMVSIQSPKGTRAAEGGDAGEFEGMKVVVLLNRASASASEVLSAALRDHGAAVIVGEPSFGKGVGQETHTLLGGRGLKITAFRWLTPRGVNLTQGDGLKPDVPVTSTKAELKSTYEAMMLRLYDSRAPSLDEDPVLAAAHKHLRP